MWNWLRRLVGGEPPSQPMPSLPMLDDLTTSGMLYAPAFAGARTVERFALGPYLCELLTDVCNHTGQLNRIEYTHLLRVSDGTGPCLFVAAEVNAMNATLGGGTHLLIAYPGGGARRVDVSDAYAGLEQFRAAAVAYARAQLRVPAGTPITPMSS